MTPVHEQPAIAIRARRRRFLAVPADLIESDLPDDAVRVFLRIALCEERGQDYELGELARLSGATPDEVEALIAMLIERGFLTDEPEETPAPRPVVVPEAPRYLDARWTGTREDYERRRAALPDSGQPVVYVLFDEDGRCAYVGATGSLRTRLRGHHDKRWTRYEARLCNHRAAADDLEVVEIAQRDPYLNRAPGSMAALKRAGVKW